MTGSAAAALWASLNYTVVAFASVTALIMGGTQNPLVGYGPLAQSNTFVNKYLGLVTDNYISYSVPADTTVNRVAVYTPEEFWPAYGAMTFDASVAGGVANLKTCLTAASKCPRNEAFGIPASGDSFVVFGYSQSGRIVTDVKRDLIGQYSGTGWQGAPDASFMVVGNPDRPNGGLLERFAGLWIPFADITFDGATPTNSCDREGCHLPTIDVAYQYDGFADFPSHPLNLLADLNAILGLMNHGSYPDHPLTEAVNQGTVGDTTYYMIPATTLPLLEPLKWLLPAPVMAALDVPLRTIIEMGYDRSAGAGTPVTSQWLRFSPVRDLITIGIAVATGIDDALVQLTGNPAFRPLGTTPAGMYGVPEFKFSDLFPKASPQPIAAPKADVPSSAATGAELAARDADVVADAPATVSAGTVTDPARQRGAPEPSADSGGAVVDTAAKPPAPADETPSAPADHGAGTTPDDGAGETKDDPTGAEADGKGGIADDNGTTDPATDPSAGKGDAAAGDQNSAGEQNTVAGDKPDTQPGHAESAEHADGAQ
ncbi:MAG: PE-PPE domain-containing protein [Mycobacterium sp.]|nr:PE-PPE domain-containing protein [Mycobacterium sp.]